jgi:predicted RNase H-like nuclease (RuvC/YqgF family)
MSNPIIETDLAEILGQINQKLDKLTEEVKELKTDVKVGFAEVKGEIKALDAQVEQLDKRITNSEFTNRGILIGIVVIILGGTAKIFGLIGN